MRVVAALHVGGAVPVITVASHHSDGARGGMVHRQVQRHDAVARAGTSNRVGIVVDACSGRGDLKAVPVVAFTLADRCHEMGNGLAAHRQMQHNSTVAAVNRLEVQIVVARRTDIEAVLVIDFARANLRREFCHGRLVQRKHQNSGVRTGIGIGAVMVVCAGLADDGVGQQPVEPVATGIHRHLHIITVVDGEVEGDDGVATVNSLQRVSVTARRDQRTTMEDVSLTLADGLGN